jgi:hypothetical protein
LLPTKLEKKRIQLQKIYEKKARKKNKMLLGIEPGDLADQEKGKTLEKSKPGLSDYEKNK